MLLELGNDVLGVLVNVLADDDCVILARVCHHLHDLVHRIKPRIIATNNVYEAVRSGMLVSLKHGNIISNAWLQPIIHMRNISIDALKYIYNATENDVVAVKLYKAGCRFESKLHDWAHNKLVAHAALYDKEELLTYIKENYDPKGFHMYRALGYAKAGNYDAFIRDPCIVDRNLKYCAHVSGDARLIMLVGSEPDMNALLAHHPDHEIIRSMTPIHRYHVTTFGVIKHILRRDDYETFNNIDIGHEFRVATAEYAIIYDAIDIVRKCDECFSSIWYALGDLTRDHSAINMTIEMAEILLERATNDTRIIKLIVSSCNYRLTEMLRARGLYNKVHTVKSDHFDFI